MPRKNIKELGHRPLVAWSIDAAKNAKLLNYFLVSTNDEEIAAIAKSRGAPVPFKRPDELGEDVDSVFPAIHAVQKYEAYLDSGRWDATETAEAKHQISYVVILQPTSPFRTSDDIDSCVRIAKTTGVDSVVSFKKAAESPFWMFTMKEYGHEMIPFDETIELQGENLVSQNLPPVFYPNGAVYVVRRDVLMSERIFGDKIYGYLMQSERSIDLEEEYDFIVAEAMIPYLASKEPFAKITWRIS